MDISVSNQLFIFAACVLCGVIIRFLFDIFRIIRRVINTSNAAAMAQDIAYWLITAALFFVFVQRVSSGELRFFQFIGLFIGMLIYFAAISALVIKVSVAVIRFLTRVLTIIIKIIMAPVVFILRIIKKPLFIVIGVGRKGGRKIRHKAVQCILNFNKFHKRI